MAVAPTFGMLCASLHRLLFALIATTISGASALAEPVPDVAVQIVGNEVRTGVSLFVPAPRERVWDVLTDFERMAEFLPDVTASRVLSRNGETVRVFQKERLRVGPFSFGLESVKEVRLFPRQKTESKLVSGSLKEYDAVTELVPAPGGTRITHRSRAVPESTATIPGESIIARGVERRFLQLRDEILRREQIARSTGNGLAANTMSH